MSARPAAPEPPPPAASGGGGVGLGRFLGPQAGGDRPGFGRMEAASCASVLSLWSPNPP